MTSATNSTRMKPVAGSIGTFKKKGARYDVQLFGVIGPGTESATIGHQLFSGWRIPGAGFQVRSKRDIPEVEHLGNWHTHHVNGLATLSQGDHATYHRIVNHDKHNMDFFYALLVVKKNAGEHPRYEVKHYFFRRE